MPEHACFHGASHGAVSFIHVRARRYAHLAWGVSPAALRREVTAAMHDVCRPFTYLRPPRRVATVELTAQSRRTRPTVFKGFVLG